MSREARSGLRAEPVHGAMVADILSDIADGRLRVGDRVESEQKLQARYGISITSIRRGMDTLVREGVLTRRRGSGTYVAKQAGKTTAIRRDTVLVGFNWQYLIYHPFFTERELGIFAGLAERGWKSRKVFPDVRAESWERDHRTINGEALLALVQAPDLAGIVATDEILRQIPKGVREGIPCVAVGRSATWPWADYDWQTELTRLFRATTQAEAKTACVVTGFSEEQVEKAQMAASCPASLSLLRDSRPSAVSAVVHSAYQRMTAELDRRRKPFDVIMATGDCELQGVLDALAAHPNAAHRRARVMGMTNQHNTPRTSLPVTALVANGEHAGRGAAELLDRHLKTPQFAPRQMTLSCNWLVSGDGFVPSGY